MKTIIEYRGERYTVPFADLFRELTPDELERLESSIIERGCLMPVIVTENRRVVDGANRLQIAAKRGITVPLTIIGPDADDDTLRQIAIEANIARRQLTLDEVRDAKAKRVARVAEKRKAGKSLRTIASEEDVSQPQIRRDLKSSGETYVPPEATDHESTSGETYVPPEVPAKIKGKDGKTYPAKKPVTPTRKKPNQEPRADLLDAVGVVIPSHLRDIAADPWMRDAVDVLTGVIGTLSQMRLARTIRGKGPAYGAWFMSEENATRVEDAIDNLDVLAAQLDKRQFHVVCPACEGAGKNCDDCHNSGWMPEYAYKLYRGEAQSNG